MINVVVDVSVDLRELLKRSLGLDVDSIPTAGATLSDDEVA